MNWSEWLAILSAVAAVTAAVFSTVAARIEIRDSSDQFIGDIHRQGWWASWGAYANVIATLALCLSMALDRFEL